MELHDAVGALDRFSSYVKWLREKNPARASSYRAVVKPVEPGGNPYRAVIADEHSETSWTGQRARHHLRQLAGAGKPFFQNVSFWKPHAPFEIPVPFDRMYSDVTIPLPKPVTLAAIKAAPRLKEMALVKYGRLSVQPVTASEWSLVFRMAGLKD